MSMSLPLSQTSTTLESCLDLFTQQEELTPDNWLANPNTGWPERCCKTLKVLTAPECLILHLKRFGRDSFAAPAYKINTLIEAPHELDLSMWMTMSHVNQRTTYRLYAVVNHHGLDPNHGHYTAYARVGAGGASCWYLFDDSVRVACP